MKSITKVFIFVIRMLTLIVAIRIALIVITMILVITVIMMACSSCYDDYSR